MMHAHTSFNHIFRAISQADTLHPKAMNTIDCIKNRRSIRHFKSEPIEHSLLEKIIDAASFSPSWKNTQIVRYVAVENPMQKAQLEACTCDWPNNGIIIHSAPMVIALTYIKNRSGFERDGSFSTKKEDRWQMFDAGIAAEAFCLAAYEYGIGSVILGIFDEERILALLNLPPERELAALIAIGYPDEAPIAPKRKSVSDLLQILS